MSEKYMEKLYIERIKNLLTDSLRALEINDENLRKILSDNSRSGKRQSARSGKDRRRMGGELMGKGNYSVRFPSW